MNPFLLNHLHLRGRQIFQPPASPLITLMKSLHPRERLQITAVAVGSPLGYTGLRRFHNAEQALRWLAPDDLRMRPVSESWQIKAFTKALTVDDLAGHARVPDRVIEEWWRRHPRLAHLRAATKRERNDD